MRAAVLYGKEDIRVQDVPVPEIGEQELLLKVKSASICGTDIRMYKNGAKGVDELSPLILGHEISGVVEKVGRAVSGYSQGMRVIVAPNMGCGICDMCVSGNTQLCASYKALGINLHGGFAEYVRIPSDMVRQGNVSQIPDTVSFEEAAIAEPFSCVYNAFQRTVIGPGDTVLIVGAGPIGILHAKLAKMAGAAKVFMHDLSAERLLLCKEIDDSFIPLMKAETYKEELSRATGGKGVDVVITACPAPQAQIDALEVAAVNGRICFFGGLPADKSRVSLDTNHVHYKQLIISGTTRSNLSQFRAVVKLIGDGLVDVRKLITAKYPVEKIQEAFTQVMQGKGMKTVISF